MKPAYWELAAYRNRHGMKTPMGLARHNLAAHFAMLTGDDE